MIAKQGNCSLCHHRKTVVDDSLADGKFVCGDCLNVLYGAYQKGLKRGLEALGGKA